MNSPLDSMRFCTSAEALIDHWLDLRSPDSLCPHKRDFSPMHIGKALPDVFLTEWRDEETVMVRVAGSRTPQVTEEDTTGKNILDVCLGEHRADFTEFYRKMRTGMFAGASVQPLPHLSSNLVAKSVQLPLLDDDGVARFFVGIVKALPIGKDLEDFREKSELSGISLNVWFHELGHETQSADAKII